MPMVSSCTPPKKSIPTKVDAQPMMVSPFGAGFFTIRDGRTGDVAFLDDYAVVPFSSTPDMFDPIPGDLDYATTDGANMAGYRSVATPGTTSGISWTFGPSLRTAPTTIP